jgi:cytochrome c biogenesis protein CcmG, thiol:disulfide interchange protein DsbE
MFPRKPLLHAVLLCAFVLSGCYQRNSAPDFVGKPAPDFTVKDGAQAVTLSQHRGKVVVLNFWATWCPPCVEEMPSLVALQHRMKDKVTVLAVSTDEDAAAYQRFIQTRTQGLLTIRDADRKSAELYGTYRYPETYVIDGAGVLRRKFIGPVDWTKPEILDYLSKL